MIEENIVVVAKKKSKQGIYKDPEKRKLYKANHAKETALKKKIKKIKDKKVVQSVEHNQSYLVIQFNRLRQFYTDNNLKDLRNWMDKIQHVNTDILEIYTTSYDYEYEYQYDRTSYKYSFEYEYDRN
jgi:fructose-1,6-bisphosphatase/inositol monophosphatase family enzyme